MAFHFIITCVSQKKAKISHSILDPHIQTGDLERVFSQWEETLNRSRLKPQKAISLYNGALWGSFLDSWGIINGRNPKANLWILSAGHGLINHEDKVIPYDITFQESRGDTPSILSKISYPQSPAARKKTLQDWWQHLEKLKSKTPQNIRDLLRSFTEDDYAFFVLSKDYLDAIYKDLSAGIKYSKYPQQIAILCNNVNDPVAKKLIPNWLYADSKFVNLPQANNTLVNAKIAHKLIFHMFEEKGGLVWWDIKNFNNFLKEVGSELPEVKKPKRTSSTDEEIKNYIKKVLLKSNVSFSRLHRSFRDGGRACEYSRFKGIYYEVKKEIEKESFKCVRPKFPVKYSPRKTKMMFFLPDWDDRVDPLFDFEKDEPCPDRDPYTHDAYHYELYGHLNCDGILVSKTVLEDNAQKKKLAQQLGIHKYLRLPRNVPVLGDCGAFNYIAEEVPPFSTKEILQYYEALDFDFGVSIDHLIVPGILKRNRFLKLINGEWEEISKKEFEDIIINQNVKLIKSRNGESQQNLFNESTIVCREEYCDEQERARRYGLTINNAKNFIQGHAEGGYSFTPIGAVQGWSPWSYAEAVKQYQEMGYEYIALGGLVRSTTNEILEVLEAVSKIRNKNTRIHLFGVARLNALEEFMRHGVSSVDSAGMLRQAWLSSTNNYYSPHGNHYTAIRIPPADKGAKVKKILKEKKVSHEELLETEKVCLRLLREYGKENLSLDEVYSKVLEYHAMMDGNTNFSDAYLRTLSEKPWEKCQCKICKDIGIDVLVFRRNNRNRRRGFHNTWIFFNDFRALTGI